MKIKVHVDILPVRIKCKLDVEVYPMMSAHDIAKYFVSLVDEDAGDTITNLKLQKLLYYAQGVNLALSEEPMFPEPIEAWAHGPVVPKVYREYRQHRGEPIPVQRVDLDFYPAELRELLDEINDVFGQFSASKLRAMTHNEPPWKETAQSEVIPLDLMKAYFKTVVTRDDGPTTARA